VLFEVPFSVVFCSDLLLSFFFMYERCKLVVLDLVSSFVFNHRQFSCCIIFSPSGDDMPFLAACCRSLFRVL
jgi:hypothetical protein